MIVFILLVALAPCSDKMNYVFTSPCYIPAVIALLIHRNLIVLSSLTRNGPHGRRYIQNTEQHCFLVFLSSLSLQTSIIYSNTEEEASLCESVLHVYDDYQVPPRASSLSRPGKETHRQACFQTSMLHFTPECLKNTI